MKGHAMVCPSFFLLILNVAQSLQSALSGHLSKYYVILALTLKTKDKSKKTNQLLISL